MHNPHGPHQAVVLVTIKAEIMERLEDGKVSGIPVEKQNDSLLFTIKGTDHEDCSEKTKQLMQELRLRLQNGKENKEE